MPSYADAIAEFSRHGYTMAHMFEVNQNDAGIAVEFDCLMVRRPASAT
jgi:hypothetical protein